MRQEPLAPVFECFRIVQAQDFNVGDEQAGSLNFRQDLRQRGNVAAGENIFRDPGAGDVGSFRAADRMQHHHALVGEQLRALLEERVVVIDANMLKHADRHNAVEGTGDIAIILQPEAGAIFEPFFGRTFVRDRVLLMR